MNTQTLKLNLFQIIIGLMVFCLTLNNVASCEVVSFWDPVNVKTKNGIPLIINTTSPIATVSIESENRYKYTLNGQKPSRQSLTYCAPIHISKNLTLKIVKFEFGKCSKFTSVAFNKNMNQTQPEGLAAINVDFSAAPNLKDFALKSRQIAEKYYPVINKLLKTPGFKTFQQVTLIFKEMDGVAATAGNTIYFAKDWYLKHPEDYGSVIHELTHVVQHYPKYEPWWLVEGIADYVRNFHYEPEQRRKELDFKGGSYKNGYVKAAGFLAWLKHEKDPTIIQRYNTAARQLTSKNVLAEKIKGRSLDQLWSEYQKGLSLKVRPHIKNTKIPI